MVVAIFEEKHPYSLRQENNIMKLITTHTKEYRKARNVGYLVVDQARRNSLAFAFYLLLTEL